MKVQNKISNKLFDKKGGKFASKYELSPCVGGLIANFNGQVLDSSYLLDTVASGFRVAEESISTYFDGSTYITYDLTGYEHLNEECHEIEIEFYNTVVINKDTTAMQSIHLDSQVAWNGIAFGSFTSTLTDEIISVATNSISSSRDGWVSATESIPIGRHRLRIVWNTSVYDIYIDGVLVSNEHSGTAAVLKLDEIKIGADNLNGRKADNTYLYNCTIKNASGVVIFQDSLAAGSGNLTAPDVGPAGTIVGYTDTPWHEDVTFGYDWNKVPYVMADGTGDYDEGAHLPASYLTEGLLLSGTARNNLDVYGYAVEFDGATRGDVDLTGGTQECHDIEVEFYNTVEINDSSPTQQLLNLSSTNGDGILLSASSSAIFKIKSSGINTAGWYDEAGVISTGSHTIRCVYVDDRYNIYLDGTRVDTITATAPVLIFDGLTIGSTTSGINFTQDLSVSKLVIKDALGIVVFDLLLEGEKDSDQSVFYDRSGNGNHVTMSGFTGSCLTARKSGSELFAKGFSDLENLIKYSEQFDNAEWSPSEILLLSSNNPAPDGSNTAFKVAASTADEYHRLQQLVGTSLVRRFGSVYVKAAGNSQVSLRLGRSSTTDKVVFDLTNETIVSEGSLVNDSGIVSVGNGWFRCWVDVTSSVEGNQYFVVSPNLEVSEAGDGESGVLIWGAQVTESILELSGYLPTTTSPLNSLVPADLTNQTLDVFGNTLTNKPGQIKDAPIELEAPDSQELYKADQTDFGDGAIDVWFEADGDKKVVTPDDLDSWTDGHINQQYFYNRDKNLMIYEEPISGNCLVKTTNYIS